jgi:hypothetical protein
MAEQSLDQQLELLYYYLNEWHEQRHPEASELHRKAAVECLWEIAMNLPASEWGDLPLPAGVLPGETVAAQIRALFPEGL